MLKKYWSVILLWSAPAISLCAQQPVPHASLAYESAPTIEEFRVAENPDSIHPLLPSEIDLLHAEVYAILGSSLVGFDFLQRPVQFPSMRDGASLGANLHHSRTSFFMSFDRQRLFSALPADGSLLESLGQKIGPSGSLLPNGSSKSAQASGQMFARLDHRLSERDSVNLRYGRSSLRGVGAPDFAQPVRALQQNGAIENTVAFSPGTLNETRGQFIEGNVQVPGQTPGYAIQSDLATMRRFRVYEAADNFTHQNLRAGGNFLFNQMSVSFLEGSLGNSTFSQSSRSAGFYAQNQWKMKPHFVLTAGARYDLEFLQDVKTDSNNFSPQVGFAWSPGGSRSTVIRGGYSLMYDQLPLPVISGALDAGGNAVNLLRSGSVTAGRNSLPITALGRFNTVNPSIQNAYAEQAHLEFEQQLGARSAFTATYEHVLGVELAVPVDGAAPLCSATGGCNAGNEVQSGGQYNSSANSTYDGLTVAFAQHPIHWGDYSVAYTYADGQSSQFDSIAGDQMRRVAFHGTVHTTLDAGSGLWQHITHGVALSGYGDFTRRNELPGLDFIHCNAQLTKGFQLGTRTRLELVAQTYNMFEHRDYSVNKAISELGEYGGALLSSYERFAAIGAPSGTQLGLQLKF